MKLKSYFNPVPVNTVFTVQIRLASDAAPAAPFVALGDVTHEPPTDNASGMQKQSLSHVIYQHVQEQVYLQKKLQDMQRINITNGGAFRLLKGMYVEKAATYIKPGEKVTLKVKVEPANATVDGYFAEVEDDQLGTVEDKTNGVFEITMPNEGITIVKIGIKNTDLYELVPIEARTVERQA